MRKALTATMAAAATGLASAQSSVQLFGELDVGVSHQRSTATDPLTGNRVTSSQTALNNSGSRASRIGLRGSEDLGGGLKASFWLEAPLANDDGSSGIASFSRRSTVSLSGRYGELRLGRDETPTYRNDVAFDPFGLNGSGASVIGTVSGASALGNSQYQRAGNSVGYFLPGTLGGFYGQVQYAFPENTRTSSSSDALGTGTASDNSGRYLGARMGYARGPLDVALSHGRSVAQEDGDTRSRRIQTTNLGASYDFGAVKLFGALSQVRNERVYAALRSRDNYNGFLFGATAPVGAGLLRAAYSAVRYDEAGEFAGQVPKVQKLSLGYEHYLSKRTSLYATVARVVNRNDSGYGGSLVSDSGTGYGSLAYASGALPRSATGYDFGIRHAF
ncbi:porin [Xenophilus arseniciresistens]|uniref:Porin n=1 Tax=Xenophilus arseniciresistens TaxID=1283306 RepID=A0AAE3ND22_9BURK|nr:porin [Xenophilus arseniciresistens]MDA7418824.1 porin [Xenophilus arseniciresistens]